MTQQQIPLFTSDGRSMGFRSKETAQRLIANGLVTAVYGRKGHLKALHSKRSDGSPSVEANAPAGTRYSFREHLECGKVAWKLKRLGKGDELRPIFMAVVTDCLSS